MSSIKRYAASKSQLIYYSRFLFFVKTFFANFSLNLIFLLIHMLHMLFQGIVPISVVPPFLCIPLHSRTFFLLLL